MAKDIRTRSGLNPDRDDTLSYSIETRHVEEFLQKKLDILSKKSGMGDIDIRVVSTEAGEKFIPFIIVLPTEVQKDYKKKQENMPEVFRNFENDNSVIRLQDYVYAFLQQYAYTKRDSKMFESQSFRQQMRIYRRSVATLRSLITPKKMKLNGHNDTKIIMLLDPIKVFYDMLGSEEDTRPYHVDITGWKKSESGKFRYDVDRVINRGKKKNYKDTMAAELNNYLRGVRK